MLLIDDRENERLKHMILAEMGDGGVSPKGQARVQRLNVGDYILGDWGVEAKEINDLYRSILGIGRSRTIVGQLTDLCATFDNPFLVVYNHELKPWFPGRRATAREISTERQKMKAVIKSFLLTLNQRFPNLRYMHLDTMQDFVDWLAANHRQGLIARASHALPAAAPKPVYVDDPRVEAVMKAGKMKRDQAEALLAHFGNLTVILRKGTKQKEMMEAARITRKQAKGVLSLRDDFNRD